MHAPHFGSQLRYTPIEDGPTMEIAHDTENWTEQMWENFGKRMMQRLRENGVQGMYLCRCRERKHEVVTQ